MTPAKQINGENLYTTGSAIYENDVMSGLRYCKSRGYADEQIVIDTIINTDIDGQLFSYEDSGLIGIL